MSQNKAQVEAEKNFTVSLIAALSKPDHIPSREEIEEMAIKLSDIINYKGSLESPIKEALYSVDSKMGLGVSLIDTEANHDEDWVFKRNDVEWFYSDAYEKHLKQEKWSPTVVQSLSDVGTKILGHLQDPLSEGSWDRRGLVIGHVQSGKTANYLGVVAKAADAGYKFIIVIAGVHNNLRKQTQERIDEGFVGRTKEEDKWKIVGVGYDDYPHPATLTNIYDDFNKKTANHSGWSINDFSKPVVLVIKKHVSTLASLHRWLEELNAKGKGKISDIPMLMIDDEADNASINTKKEDLDPTKTNRRIREILSLFDKSCYVGYTATPFANIFINPDAYGDEKLREELFPKDFIYSLDAPNTYFGPDKVFLDDESSDKILETIRDAENYLPFSHKKDYEIPDLPPSLYRAVRQFVIVKAIRSLRGQENQHCSMLVNVSRFIDIQNTVRTLINVYLKKLKEAIKANYAMSEDISSENEYMRLIKDLFEEDFIDSEFDWPTVKAQLFNAVDSIRTYVVNSKSDEPLDYKKYEKDGTGLTAIAVGGLSLSRGLTIEGLCVSYMYRNTRMYDTLMQMGRWFGYRPGFEDLCRVYLSRDSIDWYSHIAESADDLREQITQMRIDKLSPKKFGLYVRDHPDRLLVTATNKMRSGDKRTFKHNFSGRLVESYILPFDEEANKSNRDLIEKYWKSGFGKGQSKIKPTDKGWFIEDVSVKEIGSFLSGFHTHQDFIERRSAVVTYLRSIAENFSVADVILISLKDGGSEKDFKMGPQLRESAELKNGSYWRLSKDRVASRGDEKIGLDDEQKKEAVALAHQRGKKPSDFHYRSVRDKPLLMIHILDLKDKEKEISQENVPAFGISFPPGDYSKGVSVVANVVWVDQLHGGIFDAPEDEEEDDE
ncbi:MAG: endonuclease [SAR86 cluster bacterium]|uniref:Endonuclease n=1 Tax=SAR86 cluster bacterium TaxID=2030880 RepID=A0A2A5ATU2_9GAMM|nr:MAG: endonuclease [SAR86 cluster bacterium]